MQDYYRVKRRNRTSGIWQEAQVEHLIFQLLLALVTRSYFIIHFDMLYYFRTYDSAIEIIFGLL
jgi:hypothetical protein